MAAIWPAIEWQLRPIQSRPRYNRSDMRWYDNKEAKWKQETVQISDEAARVPLIDTRSRPGSRQK
jgi:hypothetical protein